MAWGKNKNESNYKSMKLINLVDDILGPSWTLGVVGQGLHGQPQLVTHGPAVGVPPGGVPQPQEPVVQEGGDQAGLACIVIMMMHVQSNQLSLLPVKIISTLKGRRKISLNATSRKMLRDWNSTRLISSLAPHQEFWPGIGSFNLQPSLVFLLYSKPRVSKRVRE